MTTTPHVASDRFSPTRCAVRAAGVAGAIIAVAWVACNDRIFTGGAASAAPPGSLSYADAVVGDHWMLMRSAEPGHDAVRFSREVGGVGPNAWDREGGGGGEFAPAAAFPGRRAVLDAADRLGPTAVIEHVRVGWPWRVWVVQHERAGLTASWVRRAGLDSAGVAATAAAAACAALMVGVAWAGWQRVRRGASAARGLCPACGHSRAGLPPAAPCPECGAPPPLLPATPDAGRGTPSTPSRSG